MKLIQVVNMLVVIERRVVLYGFVIQGNQVLGGTGPLGGQLAFVLCYCSEQSVDLQVGLGRVRDLVREETLLFELFAHRDSLPLEIFDNQRNALIRVLIHKNLENPRFAAILGPELDLNSVIGRQRVVDALHSWQRRPGQQFRYIF